MEKGTDFVLFPASVHNRTTGEAAMTDLGGNYRIAAHPRDKIVFSYLGYHPDSIVVTASSGEVRRDIYLIRRSEQLPQVEIGALTPYQQDSLERRQLFGTYLEKPKATVFESDKSPKGVNTGFGLTLHPFTYFSKEERRKRHFHKMFARYEQEAFINNRYTPALVTQLTGLTGDSLGLFMRTHQPSYYFTRRVSDLEFGSWIKQQYKAWLRKK